MLLRTMMEFIADDHAVVRAASASSLHYEDLTVVAEAANGAEVLEYIRKGS